MSGRTGRHGELQHRCWSVSPGPTAGGTIQRFEPREGRKTGRGTPYSFSLCVMNCMFIGDAESSTGGLNKSGSHLARLRFSWANKWTPVWSPATTWKWWEEGGGGGGGVSVHPPILSAGLMYTAQVAFIGFTKGLMTGIMRVMWH